MDSSQGPDDGSAPQAPETAPGADKDAGSGVPGGSSSKDGDDGEHADGSTYSGTEN
jgi:hypothetical protein